MNSDNRSWRCPWKGLSLSLFQPSNFIKRGWVFPNLAATWMFVWQIVQASLNPGVTVKTVLPAPDSIASSVSGSLNGSWHTLAGAPLGSEMNCFFRAWASRDRLGWLSVISVSGTCSQVTIPLAILRKDNVPVTWCDSESFEEQPYLDESCPISSQKPILRLSASPANQWRRVAGWRRCQFVRRCKRWCGHAAIRVRGC